MVSETEAE